MKRLMNLVLACVLGSCFVGMNGCNFLSPFSAVQGVVDIVIYWKEGEARKYYTGDVEYTYNRFKMVCADMDQTITKESKDIKGYVLYTKSKNNKFKIHVYQADPKIVCVKVRVNTMGDVEYVNLMYQKLDVYMKVKTTKIVYED
jgi:hypothetical protein